MPLRENIAEQLKSLRQANGWTQEDLAHKLGVSFATVNRWENGRTTPSSLAVARIEAVIAHSKRQRRDQYE